jgi:hypothetical protein
MGRRFRILLIPLVVALGACSGNATRNTDHGGFVERCNARLDDIRTAHGTFQARSTLDTSGGRPVVRTVVTGDRRDEVGDAIAQMYTIMREIDRAGGYGGAINAGYEQPALTWNGRQVDCRLLTVAFSPP